MGCYESELNVINHVCSALALLNLGYALALVFLYKGKSLLPYLGLLGINMAAVLCTLLAVACTVT